MTDIDMYMPQSGINGHAGQATMIEAARAVENVRAQVILARQFPRNVPAALARIRETFSVKSMADSSFYSYPRGGKNVSGSTIHLAKAVAQAWGNIDASIHELSRTGRQSEVMARAWDLETNQVMSTIFIVEHAIDAGNTVKEVTSLREIYENNANMANRRLRAMLESVIPRYVFDLAKEVASATLRSGGGEPLPIRIDKAVRKFAEMGVEAEQIEAERGRPSAQWSDIDMAHLRIVLQTIQRGEITVDEVFPPRRMTAADVAPVVPAAPAPPSPAPVADPWAGVEYPPNEDPQTGEPLPESATWPVVAQTGGPRSGGSVKRDERRQDTMPIDDYRDGE